MDWDKLIDVSSGDIRRLSSVWRYSSIPVSVPENTAEHSYWVGLYAAMIHLEIHPSGYEGETLGAILLQASIHDCAESITGDLVRPFKYSSPDFKEAVDKAEESFFSKFDPRIYGLSKIVEHAAGENLNYVKIIVKAADFLSLQQYMRREWLRGNREIFPFYVMMVNDLETMANSKFGLNGYTDKCLSDFYWALVRSAVSVTGNEIRKPTRKKI
jgi:5'-deoxynucleotidase YfbR-like HD superfamily hydrolase